MLIPKSLQNKSDWDTEKPTICITADDPEWYVVYKTWIDGKNPTNSPEWKKGIYMTFKDSSNLS